MKKIALFLSILLLIGSLVTNAQTMELTGVVTSSEDGSSIPGVSVSVKGTTLGTITDIDGNYTLKVPSDAGSLIFSFVGMATQEVAIDGKSTVNVAMENADITVDEVVVTALGIQREKKSLGFSAQEISGEAVSDVKETNFVNSLSGKVAGVNIRQSNTMGGSANVLISASKKTPFYFVFVFVYFFHKNSFYENSLKKGLFTFYRGEKCRIVSNLT